MELYSQHILIIYIKLIQLVILKQLFLSRIDDDNESNIPSPRYSHSMVAIGSNMYIFGGISSTGKSNDLYEIDTDGNSTKITLNEVQIQKEGNIQW